MLDSRLVTTESGRTRLSEAVGQPTDDGITECPPTSPPATGTSGPGAGGRVFPAMRRRDMSVHYKQTAHKCPNNEIELHTYDKRE